MKKLLSIVLSVMMCLATLTGCSLFSHDYQKDYRQVIATIAPIHGEGKRVQVGADGEVVKDANGEDVLESWSYDSSERKIYKSTLVSFLNSNANSYIQSNPNTTVEQVVEYFFDQLVIRELVMIEADLRFASGEMYWTEDDIVGIEKDVYAYLTSQLTSIYNTIFTERDMPTLPDPVTENTDTTYPVRDREDEKEVAKRYIPAIGDNSENHDAWYTEDKWYFESEEGSNGLYDISFPGLSGDEQTKSLAREGIKRLLNTLFDAIDSMYALTDAEKATVEQEKNMLNSFINDKTKGFELVWPALGKTLIVKKLIGDSYIQTAKLSKLEKFIADDVKVTDDEVLAKYNQILSRQKLTFTDRSAYGDAVENNETILYNPYDDYIQVKHILIPFSDEQKAELAKYEPMGKDKVAEMRKRMANEIIAYAHVDGEDDTSNPLTYAQIYSEIRTKMTGLKGREAERMFDDLIYKYSTDPGSFGEGTYYSVKYYEKGNFMEEFEKGAREFRDGDYQIGDLLDEPVITSYGVHIMYYAGDVKKGETKQLTDYITAGEYKTVFESLYSLVETQKVSSNFQTWQDGRIYYYRNTDNKVTVYKDRYKDIYES